MIIPTNNNIFHPLSKKKKGTYEYRCNNSAIWTTIDNLDNEFRFWDPKLTAVRVNQQLAKMDKEVQKLVRIKGKIVIPNPIEGVITADEILNFIGLDTAGPRYVNFPLLLDPECDIRFVLTF